MLLLWNSGKNASGRVARGRRVWKGLFGFMLGLAENLRLCHEGEAAAAGLGAGSVGRFFGAFVLLFKP